jgi:hypothetical protein
MADTNPSELVLKQLQEIASKSDDPTFRLRIARRAPGQTIPTVIGTMDGCGIEHLANPETWLSDFSGGGEYFLSVSHGSNRSLAFGPIPLRMAGEPTAPDAYAADKPGWRGPREIVMPTKAKTSDTAGVGAVFTNVGVTESPSTSPRNGGTQGSGSVAPASPPFFGDPLATDRMRIAQREDALARALAQAAEDRHRTELEMTRKQNELALEKLRTEMLAMKQTQPQGESAIDKMLMVMREEAKERAAVEEARRREDRERDERRLEAERLREERRLDREREDRQREADRQAKLDERLSAERKAQDDRFMTVMERLNSRPEVPPYVEKMLEDKANSAAEMLKMMTPMSEMMGSSMNMMVQMVHNMAELQPASEGDPPLVKLVGKIVDGIQAAATAARMQGPTLRPPAARTLPPRPPPAAPLTPPAAAPAPAQAATPSLAGIDSVPPTPTPIRPPKPAAAGTIFEQIIAAIKRKHDIEKLAKFFFAHVTDPSVAVELAKVNMQLLPAFAPHLMSWLAEDVENQMYVRNLLARVQEIGLERGDMEPVEGGAVEVGGEEAEAVEEEIEEGEEVEDDEGEDESDAVEEVDLNEGKVT